MQTNIYGEPLHFHPMETKTSVRKVLARHSCKVYSEQEKRNIARHYTGSADYNTPLPQLRNLIADLRWAEEVENNYKGQTLFEFCTVKPGVDVTPKLLGLEPTVRL